MRQGWNSRFLLAGGVLWFFLSLGPPRHFLEATLVGHMLLQIGLLGLAGWWVGRGLDLERADYIAPWNRYGATGLIIAASCILLWMLPRNLDAALESTAWEVAKFITVPLLAGMSLAASWFRLPAILRGVIWGQILPMLVVMGSVYRQAPVQLCNNYLLDQQELLGTGMWILAFVIAIYCASCVLACRGVTQLATAGTDAGAHPRY